MGFEIVPIPKETYVGPIVVAGKMYVPRIGKINVRRLHSKGRGKSIVGHHFAKQLQNYPQVGINVAVRFPDLTYHDGWVLDLSRPLVCESRPSSCADDLNAHKAATMAADTMPATLLDVPECVLAKEVYGRLCVKDRKSLSLTCKRLRKVALDGTVFSGKRAWVLRVDTVRDDGAHINSERINDELWL